MGEAMMGFPPPGPPDLTDLHKIEPVDRKDSRYANTKFYCGAVFVPAGTTYTRRYETASWYTNLTTTEDRWYPVFAVKDYMHSHGWRVSATVEAVVTSEFTPSSFGGVMYGNQPQGTKHRNVGSESSFGLLVTVEMFDDGTFLPVTLGFSAVRNFYVHSWANQKPDGVYHTSTWEWRPYNEATLDRMAPLPGIAVEKYGAVA